MRDATVLAAALIVLAAVYYVWDEQSDEPENDDTNYFEDAMSEVKNLTLDPAALVRHPQVQAFLALIRSGEGTTGAAGYQTMFGGGLFNSFADHPRLLIVRGPYRSTAAGAYQFLAGTWDEMRDKYDLPNFSPASQDIAAVGLIKRRGALADVLAGRFTVAINKCNKEWASLPGSPYGQPQLSYGRANQILIGAGAEVIA